MSRAGRLGVWPRWLSTSAVQALRPVATQAEQIVPPHNVAYPTACSKRRFVVQHTIPRRRR